MNGLLKRFVSQWKMLCREWNWNRTQRPRRKSTTHTVGIAAHVEYLEARTLLSATSVATFTDAELNPQAHPNVNPIALPSATATPSSGLTPSKIMSAYGFNQLSSGLNGTGQTIAIVGAYHNPTLLQDLKTFSTTFGLPDPPSFTVMSQTGSTTNLPANDPTNSWALESALDVQWAHALAPGANIVMVEANSSGFSDMMVAVKTAANLPGVSVVSMSFGTTEFATETFYDSYFKTPSGHQGVTFVASSGDYGTPADYPAYSPNVLAVGGTTLTVSSTGTYVSESAWSGSGGGISQFKAQPAYQQGIVTQSTTKRTAPDVSFDASTASSVPVISTYVYGTNTPWVQVGGTSFSAPAWGAIIATVNQARSQNGLGTLDGSTQTLPMLYQFSQTNPSVFRDITTGSNGYAAGTGYDLATGLGTPVVNALVASFAPATSSSASQLAFQQIPGPGIAGVALGSMAIALLDQNGQVVTSDNSTVTISIASGPGGFSAGSTLTVAAVNGVATFSNLILTVAGSYTFKVSDGNLANTTSNSVTINAAAAAKVVFQQVPGSGTSGLALGALTVAVQDQYGNVITSDSSSITLSVVTGPGGFSTDSTLTVAAVNGVATFNNLVLSTIGTYTFSAVDQSLTQAISGSVVVKDGLTAPSGVTLSIVNSTTVNLSWNAVSGTQGYQVFQIVGSSAVLQATVSQSTTSVQITGLVPGSTVSFNVEAGNGSAVAASSIVSIDLPQSLVTPPTLSATVLSATSVQLNWSTSPGAEGYRVYWLSGTTRYLSATLPATATGWTLTNLAKGTKYQFQVEAFQGTTVQASVWVAFQTPNSTILATPTLS